MAIQSDNPPDLTTLEQWKGLNQQSTRGSIDDQEEWWDENFFAIGPGNLRTCWGKGPPIYVAPFGVEILRFFCGTYGNQTPQNGAPPPGAMGWMFLSDGTIEEVDLDTGRLTALRVAALQWFPVGLPGQQGKGIWVPLAPQYWASARVWRPQFVSAAVGQPGGVLFGSPYGLFAWDGTKLYGPGDLAPDWLTDQQETNPPPPPGTGPPTTWNPSDQTGQVTLSNGNLTTTFAGVDQGIRAINSLAAGKFYFEETLTALAGQGAVGVGTATADLTRLITQGDGLAVVLTSGAICVGATVTGESIGQRANGDVIGIAVDMTAQLIWFRVAPNGQWNGSVPANPATGVGGVSISLLGPATTPLFPVTGTASFTATFTANFGASVFSGTVPNGFTSGWLSSPILITMPVGLPGIYAMEVYQSRLWIAGKDVISFSAPSNGADFSTVHGGGTFGYFGDKLVYNYTGLHASAGYLFVFGDSSTDLISNVQLTGQGTPESPYTTNFNYENIDPQVGQRFPRPVGVLGRFMTLFNRDDIFLMQGGDAQSIGDKITRIWDTLDPTFSYPTFAPATIFGFRVILICGHFKDPWGVTRSLLLIWHPTKGHEFWSVASQNVELFNIATYEQDSILRPYGCDLTTLYALFVQPDPALPKLLSTKSLRGTGMAQLTVKNFKRVYAEVDDESGQGVSITGTVTTGDGGVPGGVQGVDFELAPGKGHDLIPARIEGAGIWAAIDLRSTSPDFTLERIHLTHEERTLYGA